jgi:hypothetical protein
MPPRATAPRVLSAEVGRFSGDYKKVRFNTGESIGVVLEKAGITLSSGEQVNDDAGNTVAVTDLAKNNETYHLTGNFKNGN